MQLSTVHPLWSLHWPWSVQQPPTGVCKHRPWLTLQASCVHAVPSSQSLSCVQHPEISRFKHRWSTRLQMSTVQRTPSAQSLFWVHAATAPRRTATSLGLEPQALAPRRTNTAIKLLGELPVGRLRTIVITSGADCSPRCSRREAAGRRSHWRQRPTPEHSVRVAGKRPPHVHPHRLTSRGRGPA